jgi:hypothetical protein
VIDTLYYLSLCGLFAGAGLGAIRLLRPRLPAGILLLLAPAVIQALLAVALGLTVVAGIPVKYVGVPIWIALVALACYGALAMRDEWVRRAAEPSVRRRFVIMGGVAVIAAPLVMLPYFVYGFANYQGSGMLDGWAYAGFGQYLWEYPRNAEGGLAPIHQFASHLSHTRFISAAELGLLSVVIHPGDTEAASGLLRALSVFALAGACGAFARARRLPGPFASVFVVAAAICGWVSNVVWANNYDNSLALPYFPALATLAISPPGTRGQAMLSGVVAAGLAYTYPEFAVIMLGAVTLLAAESVWKRPVPGWLARTGLAILVMALLLAPYLRDLLGFFLAQASAGLNSNAARPGAGMFPGLLEPRFALPALLGLGAELQSPRLIGLTTALAATLLIVLVVGVMRLLWRGEWAVPIVVAANSAGVAFLIVYARYDYGAYKFLVIGWWLMMFVVVSTVIWISTFTARAPRLRLALAALFATAVSLGTVRRGVVDTQAGVQRGIDQYRAAERALPLIGNAPVVLIADDEQAMHWLTYFVRRTPLLLGTRKGYLGMPHVQRLLDRAQPVAPHDVRYVMTDADPTRSGLRASGWRLVFGSTGLSVWDTSNVGWAAVTEVRDGTGQPVVFLPRFKIGAPRATLELLSNRTGTLLLSARTEATGPCWQLALTSTTGGMDDVTLRPGPVTLSVPVQEGLSRLSLSATPTREAESVGMPPGTAPLMDVLDLRTGLAPTLAAGASTPHTHASCGAS